MKLKYYMRGLGIGILITTIVLSFNTKTQKLSDKEILAKARELGMIMKEETDDNLEEVLGKSLDKEIPEHIVDDNDQDTQDTSENEKDTSNQEQEQEGNVIDVQDPVEGNDIDINEQVEGNVIDIQDSVEGNDIDIDEPVEGDVIDTQDPIEEGNDIDTQDPVEEGNDIDIQEPLVEDNDMDVYEVTFEIVRGMSSYQVSELLFEKGLIGEVDEFNDYIKQKGKAGVIRIGSYSLSKDASYQEILEAIVS